MKILAIRGKNLASLAGEFAVDFTHEPLASAGLFAISGSTGAGKSTLLDALCLALFDNTPRLKAATGRGINIRDVGDETISPSDARNVLRRGCAEGYAEVDFAGLDGKPYRARWSIRRARDRNDGKLQKASVQLTELSSGLPIGGTNREVLEAIEMRLGLSFEQFTRAVLLAQNEFGAFLKASDDERSNLLQTLTGTEIYSRISRQAFERSKAESEALRLLNAELQGQLPLDEAQRAGFADRIDELSLNLAEQEKVKLGIDEGIAWHGQKVQLEQAYGEAVAGFEKAQVALSEAGNRQQQLALVEAAEVGRSLVQDLDGARAECLRGREGLGLAGKALDKAKSSEQASISLHEGALKALQQAEKSRAETLPDLRLALQLDTELGALLPHYTGLKEAQDVARLKEQTVSANFTGRQKDLGEALGQLGKAETWLRDNDGWRLLAEDWGRWDLLLQEAAKADGEQKAIEGLIAGAEKQVGRLEGELVLKAEVLGNSQTLQQDALIENVKADGALSGFDMEVLTLRLSQAAERREQLGRLERQYGEVLGLDERLLAVAEKQSNMRADADLQRSFLKDVEGRLPVAEAEHQQAVRMLKIAEAASSASVEQLRAGLEAGQPCPVCGALEHPYGLMDDAFRRQLQGLEAEVSTLQQTLNELLSQAGRAHAHTEQLDRQLLELSGESSRIQGQLESLRPVLSQLPFYEDLLAVVPEIRAEWFVLELQKAAKQHGDAEADMKAMGLAQEQSRKTRKVLDEAVEQLRLAVDGHDAACLALKEARGLLDSEARKRDETGVRLEGFLGQLDLAFGNVTWRPDFQRDASVFHEKSSEKVRLWQEQQRLARELGERIVNFRTELEGLSQAAAEALTNLAQAEKNFAAADEEMSRKRKAREGLLAGKPVEEVEALLDAGIAEGKRQEQLFAGQLREAREVLVRCREALDLAEKDVGLRETNVSVAEAKLADWLAVFAADCNLEASVDEALLRSWLAYGAEWIQAERQFLQGIKDARQAASVLVKERLEQLQRHVALWPEPEAFEMLKERLDGVQEVLKALRLEQAEVLGRIGEDDRRRLTSASLLARIEAQQARAGLWASLNELIGSADGKKFRNIAQQITLDSLLGFANQHLRDLSRRYRLERVTGTLALQVIDQDMGDEIRSVHSLSGGESFLVSLALALGLASLSSNRVRVESLFIDEGFGSLDAETLRVAMDALDRLQALGRKVGVISHVQEMTERIGTRIEVRRGVGGRSSVVVRG